MGNLWHLDCSKTLKLCLDFFGICERRASARAKAGTPTQTETAKPPAESPQLSQSTRDPCYNRSPSVWCAAPEVVPIFEARRVSEIRIIRSATAFCGHFRRLG